MSISTDGFTAALDLALAMVEKDLGADVARSTAQRLVMQHRRAGGSDRHARECPESGRYTSFEALADRLKLPRTLLVEANQSKGEMIVRSHYFAALYALLSVVASIPAHAEADLIGKWVGQFNGVQIEIPPERGPFGYLHEGAKAAQTPRFVEKALQLDIETQSKGLAVGTWTAGEFKKRFVCAQVSQTVWNCIDSGGRASVDVTSPSELKVCYFDNREGAEGAGCAILRRTK